MQESCFRAFLTNLFDYAGLYPPASLPLEKAIQNYSRYQKGEDAWMLGRFIINATRLRELHPFMALFSPQYPLSCSALGRKSDNERSCLEGLHLDLAEVAEFKEQYQENAPIHVFELPLPPVIPGRELLEDIAKSTAELGLQTFCELTMPRVAFWEGNLFAALDQIAEFNACSGKVLGVKLRTGGLTPDVFPTPAQVALVLIGCRDRGLPLKFTAGLHHPVRMYRSEVGTKMHGFLNIYCAGLLAHAFSLPAGTVEQVVADESASHFSLNDDEMGWQNKKLTASEITRLRHAFLRSYGSCSFDEPREDLQALQMT